MIPLRDAPGPAILTAGFRPFFLFGAAWAAFAVPLWLAAYAHGYGLRATLDAMTWHAHEMVYGFGVAAVAGFLLTALPNGTGRLALRGAALGALVALWAAGRIALLAPAVTGPAIAAVLDLAFLAALMGAAVRELIAGRSWRNLPMLGALALLLGGNVLVHLQSLGVADTAQLGNRLGIATLLALIALIGGRIVPGFTRNWLVQHRPGVTAPAAMDRLDALCLLAIVAALAAWVVAPGHEAVALLQIAGAVAAALRLGRWRGLATLREPLVLVLHTGYAWLAVGLAFLGLNSLTGWAAPAAPLHALTIGAIGTMTLAVMTRATLGHTGRPLTANALTCGIYLLITLAAALRLAAALSGGHMLALTSLAGIAWSAAFLVFLCGYGPLLVRPRA